MGVSSIPPQVTTFALLKAQRCNSTITPISTGAYYMYLLLMLKTDVLQYCTCTYTCIALKFQIFEGFQVRGPVITNNTVDLVPVLCSIQVKTS